MQQNESLQVSPVIAETTPMQKAAKVFLIYDLIFITI